MKEEKKLREVSVKIHDDIDVSELTAKNNVTISDLLNALNTIAKYARKILNESDLNTQTGKMALDVLITQSVMSPRQLACLDQDLFKVFNPIALGIVSLLDKAGEEKSDSEDEEKGTVN